MVEKIDQGRRDFLSEYLPKGALTAYGIRSGLAMGALEFIADCLSTQSYASENTNRGYVTLEKERLRIEKSGELEKRLKQRDIYLSEGLIEQSIDDYKGFQLVGSLLRYKKEPSNEKFFETFKNVINNFHKSPTAFVTLLEFQQTYKKEKSIEQTLFYSPEFSSGIFFEPRGTMHGVYISRSFENENKIQLTARILHEFVAHGYQEVEFKNGFKHMSRRTTMSEWETELEGYAIEWYATEEMNNKKEIKKVKLKIRELLRKFPEWRDFGINEIHKMQAKDLVNKLMTHYKDEYNGQNWLKTTYLLNFMD